MNIVQNSFHCSFPCPLFPGQSRTVSFFGHKQQTIAKKAEILFDSLQQSSDTTTKDLILHSFSHLTQKGKNDRFKNSLSTLLDHLTAHYENTTAELLFLAEHIDILPSVTALQKTISQKSSPLSQALANTKEKLSILQTWKDLHLDMSLLETDFESVQFLVKERLIYTIVGLKNTSLEGKRQLHIENGKIFIKCDNVFTPVSSLINRFKYVKEDLQYREKETNLAWNYLLPQGFVQIDRCESKNLLPTTLLTSKEKETLLKHAQKFEGIQFSKENPPVGVLQIVTNPRKMFHHKESFLTDGLDAHTPVHVSFRFIDEKGNVYSSGFGSTAQEDTYCTGKHNYLASINGMPSITDYEEFRPNEGRRVSSVPLSKEHCDAIRKEVTKMRQQTVRFNILTQNCSLMATRLLEVVGIKIQHDSSAYTFLRGLLPSLTSSSTLLHTTQKILLVFQKVSEKTLLPSFEEDISFIGTVLYTLTTPLRLITNVALNLLLIRYGAHKGSPLKENMYGEKPEEKMKKFFAIISSKRDLFKTPTIFHSGPIIEWQDAQKTTCFYEYKSPSMNILPRGSKEVPGGKRRPYARFAINRQSTTNKLKLALHRKQFFQTAKHKIKSLLPKKIKKGRGHTIRASFFKLWNAARRRYPNNLHASPSTS